MTLILPPFADQLNTPKNVHFTYPIQTDTRKLCVGARFLTLSFAHATVVDHTHDEAAYKKCHADHLADSYFPAKGLSLTGGRL